MGLQGQRRISAKPMAPSLPLSLPSTASMQPSTVPVTLPLPPSLSPPPPPCISFHITSLSLHLPLHAFPSPFTSLSLHLAPDIGRIAVAVRELAQEPDTPFCGEQGHWGLEGISFKERSKQRTGKMRRGWLEALTPPSAGSRGIGVEG
jgi:hypothetical protein